MLLEIKDLHKSFEGREVLHGISLSVESGKALGLLGRNGAGKTTTIRIIMDIFKADSGEILMDSKKFIPANYKIGYLPEERGLYPKKKVADQLVYLAMLRGYSKAQATESVKRWLERLQISEYENKKLETLSKGNQQKIQLAQALLCDPDIVILDEPFSGLDPINSQILKDIVKQMIADNKIVIFSSHQMTYVEEFCEDIAIINNGEVALYGNLKDIKREFGENQLILSANNYTLDELIEKCRQSFDDIASVCDKNKDFIVLKLKESKDKNTFLQRLAENSVDIEKFGDYQPSLTDIFVKVSGD